MNGCRTWATGHRWHPISGWCENGCGWRDDGAFAHNGQIKHPGPNYTSQQLHDFHQKARNRP